MESNVFIDDYLCTVLDILRNKLGKPVIITSGYRTPEWNANAKEQNTATICAVWLQISGLMA